MKAYLQSQNGLYYQAGGDWTSDVSHAMEFPTTAAAREFLEGRRMPGVHPVLRIDPGLQVLLAVRAPGMFQAGE